MHYPNQQQDPSAGAVKLLANALGALATFLFWPALFYGTIDGVQAYAAQNYSALPPGLISVFWGGFLIAAIFGGVAALSILGIRMIQAAFGSFFGGGR